MNSHNLKMTQKFSFFNIASKNLEMKQVLIIEYSILLHAELVYGLMFILKGTHTS